MIKQHYSGSARRSVNIIWNAAQSYGFDPPFLAFFANGQPDDYLNMIIVPRGSKGEGAYSSHAFREPAR